MSFRTKVLSFIEQCQQSDDLASNIRELHRLADPVGFGRLTVVNTWQVGESTLSGISTSALDKGALDAYGEGRWHLQDPIWQRAELAGKAFAWSDVWASDPLPRKDELANIYEDAEIADGLTVPVFDQQFRKSLVTLVSDRKVELDADEAAMLTMALIVFRRSAVAGALNEPALVSRDPLTMREREILRWTAAGKSAWEISTILSLSEATVARHLLNIRGKMRVSNTVQAVAEAIRSQELVL